MATNDGHGNCHLHFIVNRILELHKMVACSTLAISEVITISNDTSYLVGYLDHLRIQKRQVAVYDFVRITSQIRSNESCAYHHMKDCTIAGDMMIVELNRILFMTSGNLKYLYNKEGNSIYCCPL